MKISYHLGENLCGFFCLSCSTWFYNLPEKLREECTDINVIDAAIRESRRLYEEGMAQCAAELRQKEELYARARTRLPEVRAAYEKLIKSSDTFKKQ